MNAGSSNFDEMFDSDGRTRPAYAEYCRWYNEQPPEFLRRKNREADDSFRRTGITFNVYGEDAAEERLIPFDMVPRIITASEWRKLSRGIEQRVRALNSFLYDLYHRQEIVRAGRLPERLLRTNDAWLANMVGFTPPGGIYTHIVGIDLVRTGPDEFFVLEDNARTPSGVSYMLENREMMMRLFPDLFADYPVRPVETYTDMLLASLRGSAPEAAGGDPTIVVLTPGPFNSAYYEHSFLADKLGVDLVEGRDLIVNDGKELALATADTIERRLADEQQAHLRRPRAQRLEQTDLGGTLVHRDPGHVHDQDAGHQQADRGNPGQGQAEGPEDAVESLQHAVLADQGDVVLAFVAGLDGVDNLSLAAGHKMRPAQFGEHPEQPLAVEQHLGAGHRDDQHLAEIHA